MLMIILITPFCCGSITHISGNVVHGFNPLSPNGDQRQISPCNINAYSTPKVMRMKDMITQSEFS